MQVPLNNTIQVEQAEKDLVRLRKTPNIHAEIEQMKIEAAAMRAVKVVAWGDMFKHSLLWPLIVCCMLMVSQQLSGINAVSGGLCNGMS